MFNLNGKSAVVIGGAGGIGKAISKGLALAGANVIIASRNESALIDACEDINVSVENKVRYLTVDAGNEESMIALTKNSIELLGKIDILVNSQGFNKKYNAEEFPLDEFSKMFDVNVNSFMLSCKHIGKHMIDNKYGKIINITSVRGKIATKPAGNAGYCATKGAVDMLTKQLASEYGKYNITVNGIGPNLTITPMMEEWLQSLSDEKREELKNKAPMQRMAVPEDCVGPALFLASEASGFVTGNIIYPDGGLTAIG
ncbi:SDR family NAD(P)-dependent oxidoreductase [Photobacterium sp. DNB23_23_1]